MNTESFLSLHTFWKFAVFVSLVEVFSFLFVFVFYCTFHACFLTVAIAYCMSTLPASANKKALVGFGTAHNPGWRTPNLGVAEQIRLLAHRVKIVGFRKEMGYRDRHTLNTHMSSASLDLGGINFLTRCQFLTLYSPYGTDASLNKLLLQLLLLAWE